MNAQDNPVTVGRFREILETHDPDAVVYIDAGTEYGPIYEVWQMSEPTEPGDHPAGLWISYDPDAV